MNYNFKLFSLIYLCNETSHLFNNIFLYFIIYSVIVHWQIVCCVPGRIRDSSSEHDREGAELERQETVNKLTSRPANDHEQ